jgi:hypothetical protein
MPKARKEVAPTNSKTLELVKEEPRSLAIAERGVKTGADFANMMSALMSDIVAERITPNKAHAACNAGRQLLKVVEMQYRYGGKENTRALTLAPGSEPEQDVKAS